MLYELKLEEKEVNLVLTGLAQLSYIQSATLINKITKCVTSQKDDKSPKKKKDE